MTDEERRIWNQGAILPALCGSTPTGQPSKLDEIPDLLAMLLADPVNGYERWEQATKAYALALSNRPRR